MVKDYFLRSLTCWITVEQLQGYQFVPQCTIGINLERSDDDTQDVSTSENGAIDDNGNDDDRPESDRFVSSDTAAKQAKGSSVDNAIYFNRHVQTSLSTGLPTFSNGFHIVLF